MDSNQANMNTNVGLIVRTKVCRMDEKMGGEEKQAAEKGGGSMCPSYCGQEEFSNLIQI